MKFPTLVVGALASLATAHSDPRDVHAGIPKMVGGRKFLAELKAKNALPEALQIEKRDVFEFTENQIEGLEERQVNANGQCGKGFGKCPTTQCCSIEG